jgi:hypothetical protein
MAFEYDWYFALLNTILTMNNEVTTDKSLWTKRKVSSYEKLSLAL